MRYRNQNWFFKFGSVALAAMVCLSGESLYAQRFDAVRYLLAAQKGEERESAAAYWIGVACEPLPDALRAQLNLPERQGVLVQDVVKDGPAGKAGLKQFDVLLSIGDEALASPQDLSRFVVASRGEGLTIRYLRAGKEQSVTVKPAERPSRFDMHDDAWVVPEGDQASLQNWLERLRPGMGPNPLAMRFFHPGMVLPPGAAMDAELPDDMSVTITRRGKEPAKISVKQGEQSWEVTEETLDELPDDVRAPVERMLGRVRPGMNILNEERGAARNWQGFRQGDGGKPADDADSRIERQIDELREQLRQLQQAVDKLQSAPSPEK